MYELNSFLPAGSGWSVEYGNTISTILAKLLAWGTDPAGIIMPSSWTPAQVTYSYTSTGSAVSIKDKSTASKSMTLTDNETITDLNVKVTLYSHAVRRPEVRTGRPRQRHARCSATRAL